MDTIFFSSVNGNTRRNKIRIEIFRQVVGNKIVNVVSIKLITSFGHLKSGQSQNKQ
jgi:hypothetical protein